MQVANYLVGATPEQVLYSYETSAVRESVEWSYKELKQMWKRSAFLMGFKERKTPVTLIYICSAVLLNFKTCLDNGGQVDSYSNFSSKSLSYVAAD